MESGARTYVAGSDADFDHLYRETYPRLVRTLGVMMKNSAEAEDCVQDAYVKAYANWSRWRGDAPAEAWLWRIAMNVANSRMRANRMRAVPELIKRLGRPKLAQDPANEVVADDLRRALLALEPRMRTSVVMRHLHGFTTQEIADMLQTDARNIYRWIEKAEERLKEALGETWLGPDTDVQPEEVEA